MATIVPPSLAPSARVPGVRLAWGQRVPARPPISGVPLFVGFIGARRAESEAATDAGEFPALAFNRWEQYVAVFGESALGYLDYAVRGFFENGGAVCWVVAIAMQPTASAATLQASLTAAFSAGGRLEDLAEPDLLCVPDAGWGVLGEDADAMLAVQAAVLAHCNRMNDRFAVFDCLPARRPADIGTAADGQALANSLDLDRLQSRARLARLTGVAGEVANGAVYWPWIRVAPLRRHSGQVPTVPPCGHVAGVYARLDAATGRHKAPANELVEGAFDVEDVADEATLAEMNDAGANSLRALTGRGVRICGARTLSSRPAWRYVNVRRVVLGLARWAESGLRDLVMEGNRPELWERIRQRVDSYCLARHRDGSLLGDAPADAYFVKCDAETNPAASRELGRVVCEVGLAIAAPAEFIVVQLVQSVEGRLVLG